MSDEFNSESKPKSDFLDDPTIKYISDIVTYRNLTYEQKKQLVFLHIWGPNIPKAPENIFTDPWEEGTSPITFADVDKRGVFLRDAIEILKQNPPVITASEKILNQNLDLVDLFNNMGFSLNKLKEEEELNADIYILDEKTDIVRIIFERTRNVNMPLVLVYSDLDVNDFAKAIEPDKEIRIGDYDPSLPSAFVFKEIGGGNLLFVAKNDIKTLCTVVLDNIDFLIRANAQKLIKAPDDL